VWLLAGKGPVAEISLIRRTVMENTEPAAQVAARATSTDPDGDRITVTLSIDVELEVERLGDFYYAYRVEGGKPAEQPLLSAWHVCDVVSQYPDKDLWHADLNKGAWNFGGGPDGTSLREAVVAAVQQALLLQIVPRYKLIAPPIPPTEIVWEQA
jgi:hypothetical protein